MKKYPVTYKGEEYEVCWRHDIFDYIDLYRVYPERKIFKKKFVYTTNTFDISLDYMEKLYKCKIAPEELYIYQVKTLIYLYEEDIKAGRRAKTLAEQRLTVLKEWDGNVEL